MAKTDFKTVDEYIRTFQKDVQGILETIRTTIQTAVPEAEEVISYQMPAFKFYGWVLYFSAYKNHYSLSCPPPFTVFDVFKTELAPYEVSKSAIKFPMDKPVPVALISEIARYRAGENLKRHNKKAMKQ